MIWAFLQVLNKFDHAAVAVQYFATTYAWFADCLTAFSVLTVYVIF
jgi:hypothetical protein